MKKNLYIFVILISSLIIIAPQVSNAGRLKDRINSGVNRAKQSYSRAKEKTKKSVSRGKEKVKRSYYNAKEIYKKNKEDKKYKPKTNSVQERSHIKPSKISSYKNRDIGAIHGRVWVNNSPSKGVFIKVIDIETNSVVATTTTQGGKGSSSGLYQLTNLPSNKKYKIVASWKNWSSRPHNIQLNKGAYEEANIMIEIKDPRPQR